MTTEKQTPRQLADECLRLAIRYADVKRAKFGDRGVTGDDSVTPPESALRDLSAAIDRLAALATARQTDPQTEYLRTEVNRLHDELVARQAERLPLTEERIHYFCGTSNRDEMTQRMVRNIARWIEHAHGIEVKPADAKEEK